MNFEGELQKYLRGQLFDTSLRVDISATDKRLSYSIPFLTALARDRRVIHIGAVDHLQSIDRVIEKGKWLHHHFMAVSSKCIGIDIDRKGIEYLKERHGIDNIYCADVTKDDLAFLGQEKWDVVFVPDVLEHIRDVYSFLRAIHTKFAGRCDHLVIAVPNAFCLRNFTNAVFKGAEKINSDHRYWFTPYTLAKLLVEAGFREEHFCLNYVMRGLERKDKKIEMVFKKLLWKSRPCLRDTIVIEARF